MGEKVRALIGILPWEGCPELAADQTQDSEPAMAAQLGCGRLLGKAGPEGPGKMGQCTCQVEVGDGALGPDGGHHMRMQAAQVMVSPIAGALGSSQIVLIGQRGSSSHTVHLRRKHSTRRLGVRLCEILLSYSSLFECADGLCGFPAFPGAQLPQGFTLAQKKRERWHQEVCHHNHRVYLPFPPAVGTAS